MNFVKTILTGFCWGLGFGIALTSTFWVYGTYVDTPAQIVEHTYPDDDYDNIESLKKEELENLNVSITDKYMVEGKIIISGTVINRNDRDVFWIEIKTNVLLEDKIIEICVIEDRHKVESNKEIEFISFCGTKWNELNFDNLRIETEIEKASAYKNT